MVFYGDLRISPISTISNFRQRRCHFLHLINSMLKTLFLTQLAAGFAAKGLLILMTSISVAIGLAHSILIIWFDQIFTPRAMLRRISEEVMRADKMFLMLVLTILLNSTSASSTRVSLARGARIVSRLPLHSATAGQILHDFWRPYSYDNSKLKLFYNGKNLPVFFVLHLKLGVTYLVRRSSGFERVLEKKLCVTGRWYHGKSYKK